jgi:hypothetical protein
MKCKIFHADSRDALEKAFNDWINAQKNAPKIHSSTTTMHMVSVNGRRTAGATMTVWYD